MLASNFGFPACPSDHADLSSCDHELYQCNCYVHMCVRASVYDMQCGLGLMKFASCKGVQPRSVYVGLESV